MSKEPHRWAKDETQYLIDHYTSPESASAISSHLGISAQQVGRKARSLGFSMRENQRQKWSTEELTLLEAWAETMSLIDLAASWNERAKRKGWPRRSPDAIGKTLRKLGYTAKPLVGCYPANAVAAALGVSEWAVKSWIKSGALKAKKQGLGEHSNHVIRDEDIASFALEHPAKIARNITPESAEWLLYIIANSKKALTEPGNY